MYMRNTNLLTVWVGVVGSYSIGETGSPDVCAIKTCSWSWFAIGETGSFVMVATLV